MRVTKHSGEQIAFNPESLKNSLRKSGANDQQIDDVFNNILKEMYDGITTRALYEMAFGYLKKHKTAYAAKYSLKKALRDLGPNGFYFEKWVCSLLHYLGFQSVNGQTLQGHAVTHEIDVIAIKNDEFNIIECKLRNDIDAKISVTTPMYFLSRMQDLANKQFHYFDQDRFITNGWLVTNAYFTKDSIAFGNYYGIKLLSWDFPNGNSIKNLTDDGGLYPITCLTVINSQQKSILLDNDMILVQNILDQPEQLKQLLKHPELVQQVLKEAQELIALK